MSKLWDMWLMDIREMIERQDEQKKMRSPAAQHRKQDKKPHRQAKT